MPPLRPCCAGLRASLARSPPRLRRSQAGGLLPPDPQGCAPCAPFGARAPAMADQEGGVPRHGWEAATVGSEAVHGCR